MRVYVASHSDLAIAETILDWAGENYINMIASWPGMLLAGVPESSWNAKVFWQLDIEEVKNADVLVVLPASHDPLRGALVEVGVALGADVPVVLVGDYDSYGSWRHHPLVHKLPDLESVKPFLDLLGRIHG